MRFARTRHFIVVELIAVGPEVLLHARDVGICDILLPKELQRMRIWSRTSSDDLHGRKGHKALTAKTAID